MTDRYAPRPEHKFSFGLWTVGNRGRDPFGDVVRDPLPPVDAVALLARSRRVGREPPRQRPRADRRHARRARPHRRATFKTACRDARHRRADGDRQPVLRSGVPRRRLHLQRRRASAPMRVAEDDARDGSRRGARRQDLRAVGRARGHRNRRLPPPGRSRSSACARRSTSSASTRSIAEYGFQFALEAKPNEPRGDIYMATTGALSGLHPHARSSRDGRREPRGRARDRWPG